MRYRENLRAFARALDEMGGTRVLVIGVGSQKTWLDKFFAAYPAIRVVYSDVDIGGSVELFCDPMSCHSSMPRFDGLVASAELEHVLHPECVPVEMHRVLVGGGLIYSEIPFLQQVHEEPMISRGTRFRAFLGGRAPQESRP